MRTIIVTGTVVDTEPRPHVVPDAVVVIEDGVIVSVGPRPDARADDRPGGRAQLTPDHTDAAVEALRESGVRAVFGYAHRGTGDADRAEDEVRRVRSALLPSDDGLVTPAFAAWGPVYGSVEAARADWALARDLGLRISCTPPARARSSGGTTPACSARTCCSCTATASRTSR